MNRVVLTACIAEREALRYTPAGMPAVDVRLEHESTLLEAGQPRQVKAVLKAVAFGAVAERLGHQNLGSRWQFTGFLVSPQRRPGRSASTVLHIQEFQPD